MSQKMGQGQTMGQLSQKVGQMSQNLNFKDKKWDKVLNFGTMSQKWDICPRQDRTMGQVSQKIGTNVPKTSKNGTTLGQCPKKWDMGQTGHYLIIYNSVCPCRDRYWINSPFGPLYPVQGTEINKKKGAIRLPLYFFFWNSFSRLIFFPTMRRGWTNLR